MFDVVYGRQRPEMELQMTRHRSFRLIFVFVLCLLGTPLQPCPRMTRAAEPDTVRVTDFLPNGYVTDGSVCYQTAIQKAMDQAAARHQHLTFPPMIYRIDDPAGLRLQSGTTLSLHGAVLRVSASAESDGQVFLGQDVTDVTIRGGEIAGQRDSWPDSVNISAIRIRGRSARIRVRDTYVHDMSSNAVGVFGTADQPITHVWVRGLLAQRCCNKYTDYLLPNQGPAKGSSRMDQGVVALYYVHNFVVDNLFDTTAKQGAAIRVQPKVADIIIENNTFRGAVRQVIVQGHDPDVVHVVVKNNDGVEENRRSAHRTVRPHASSPAVEKTNNVP